jgi:hypothetical protein
MPPTAGPFSCPPVFWAATSGLGLAYLDGALIFAHTGQAIAGPLGWWAGRQVSANYSRYRLCLSFRRPRGGCPMRTRQRDSRLSARARARLRILKRWPVEAVLAGGQRVPRAIGSVAARSGPKKPPTLAVKHFLCGGSACPRSRSRPSCLCCVPLLSPSPFRYWA